MTTPQSKTPKPRRSAKKGNLQQSKSAISENEASDYSSLNQGQLDAAKSKPRRKSHATKPGTIYDSGTHSDNPTNSYPHQYPKAHVTPIKQQAYAGPTFHQSPAASALPMPSFYSKSLPSTSMMQPVPEESRPVTEQGQDKTAGQPEVKRESTPLDFLFEAARKAHPTPGAESPQRRFLSPAFDHSPSRSPGPRDPDVFHLELDTGARAPEENHSTTSTPFKDRLEAARPIQTNSPGAKPLDEAERKAKTAALKNFLMSSAQAVEGVDNPFNARPAPQPGSPRYQQRSNPTTPSHAGYTTNKGYQYFPQMTQSYGPLSPNQRPPSSNLRHIYMPDSTAQDYFSGPQQAAEAPRVSTAREHNRTPPRQAYQGYYTPPAQPSPSHQSTPSAQQLEDDLRKFLKLDLTSRG